MSRAMINIKASKKWGIKETKTYYWDQDEASRRIYNDLDLYDGNIVSEDKKLRKVIK